MTEETYSNFFIYHEEIIWIPLEFLPSFKNKCFEEYNQLEWAELCLTNLSENFIRKYYINVNWDLVCEHSVLSEEFIEEFALQVNWNKICQYQQLSEDFITKHNNKLIHSSGDNWLNKLYELYIFLYYTVFTHEDISTLSIYRINWKIISKHQKLSEKFIKKFSNEVYWSLIIEYQDLSNEFIENIEDDIRILYYGDREKSATVHNIECGICLDEFNDNEIINSCKICHNGVHSKCWIENVKKRKKILCIYCML